MPSITTYSDHDTTIRMQITLTAALKKAIEEETGAKQISVSEYLRRGAVLQLLLENQEKDDLKSLAAKVIGSVDLKKHPEWKSEKEINKWIKNLRKTWE